MYRDLAPPHPRSLRDPDAVAKRRSLLTEKHLIKLATYVENLRTMGRGEVPNFDPLDGGDGAQALFLFEKPVAAARRPGTGTKPSLSSTTQSGRRSTLAFPIYLLRQANLIYGGAFLVKRYSPCAVAETRYHLRSWSRRT
jgi:hypothetical protein